jgi:dTDP-glucose 4,6-dehydratase
MSARWSAGDVVWVTGGAGFIGSALVRRLIADSPATVVNIDALTYAGNRDSLGDALQSPRHILEHIDICDAHAIAELYEAQSPSCVFHLAAESHVDRSIDGPAAFVKTNLLGTFTLLELGLRYWRGLSGPRRDQFRFVHVSTDEVFGSLGPEGRFTEDSPYQPNSPYSATKAGADHLARAWAHTYGFPVVTTNCSNNFGPFQFPEKLIPLMIRRATAWQSLPVYGSGANVRDWLHVDDHVAGLICAAERGQPGRTYNIGAGNERTNLQVVTLICDILDELQPDSRGSHRQLVTFVTDRPGHDLRYAIDSQRVESELGWRPSRSFEEGLRATVRWYLENDAWCERVETGAYRGERLGLAGTAA